jgi:hypothetical protein
MDSGQKFVSKLNVDTKCLRNRMSEDISVLQLWQHFDDPRSTKGQVNEEEPETLAPSGRPEIHAPTALID